MAEGGAPAPGQRSGLAVPELLCPFPERMNPLADGVGRSTIGWAASFGLVGPSGRPERALRAAAAGRLAGRLRPRADREELSVLSDLYAWMFLQDDRRDETEIGLSPGGLSEGDARFLTILEEAAYSPGRAASARTGPGDGPAEAALLDLAGRLFRRAPTAGWRRRFVRAFSGYLAATTWEARNRARGVAPDPASYRRMRPLTAGLGVDDELLYWGESTRPPPAAPSNPAVRRLLASSALAVCWANDLYSLPKELAGGEEHNLVVVIARAEGVPLAEALGRVARAHDEEVASFLALKGRVLGPRPTSGSPASISSPPPPEAAVTTPEDPTADRRLAAYVAALEYRMRGNIEWSRETSRYQVASEARIASAPSGGTGLEKRKPCA